MKICWDNLEKLRYNKRTGKWYTKSNTYIYKENCLTCQEPFLSERGNNVFCCNKCKRLSEKHKEKISKNHAKYYKGKSLLVEHKRKISKANKGKKFTENHRKNMSIAAKNRYSIENNPFYGKKHTKETRKKMSESHKGKKHSEKTKKKIGNGGYFTNNIPVFDTYVSKISFSEQIRRNGKDPNILEVKCAYCGKWFVPTIISIHNRIQSLQGQVPGENRLYCSTQCKKECPTYRQKLYPKSFKPATSREVQPELRQLCFERDNWICQKCGSKESLHCHHIEGIRWEPLESADLDKVITLCKECHKEVHKLPGCGYNDMRCN